LVFACFVFGASLKMRSNDENAVQPEGYGKFDEEDDEDGEGSGSGGTV